MKKAILKNAALICCAALMMSGCGNSSAKESEKTNNTSTAEAATTTTVTNGKSADESVEKETVKFTLLTYHEEDMPEMAGVINNMLKAASNANKEDFESAFDVELILKALLSTAEEVKNGEAAVEDLLAEYDEEQRQQIIDNCYNTVADAFSQTGELNSDLTNFVAQTELFEGETEDLNADKTYLISFDVDINGETISFFGTGYHVDGEWGAMFERKSDDSQDTNGELKTALESAVDNNSGSDDE